MLESDACLTHAACLVQLAISVVVRHYLHADISKDVLHVNPIL